MFMKTLKWILALIGALALIVGVGGLLLSPKFNITRVQQIGAAPEKVYALVASPRAWKLWSVWMRRDPAMAITYEGPESGAGAVWDWKSASEGDGRMRFTAADPPRRVVYDLYFPDFGTTSTGELRFKPLAGGTEVTWTMAGDMGSNPLFHWFALFADRMVGKDFEDGLANLKRVAEQP